MIYQLTDSTKGREDFFFPLRINSSARQIFISILTLPIEKKKNLLWDMPVNLSDQAHKQYKMQEFLSCEKDCSVAKYIKSE